MDRFLNELLTRPEDIYQSFYQWKDNKIISQFYNLLNHYFDDREELCPAPPNLSFIKFFKPYYFDENLILVGHNVGLFTQVWREIRTDEKTLQSIRKHWENCHEEISLPLVYLGADRFTHNFFLSLILRDLPTILPILDVEIKTLDDPHFSSEEHTYALVSYPCPDLGSLTKMETQYHFYPLMKRIDDRTIIHPPIIKDLVSQVLLTLHYLQREYNFLGTTTIGQIFLFAQPITWKYDGYSLNSSLTCRLGGLSQAAITLPGTIYRLYPQSRLTYARLLVSPFEMVAGNYYRLNTALTGEYYQWSLNTGLPVYYSLDTYFFILSFLHLPMIYASLNHFPDLKRMIWDPLWIDSEGSQVWIEMGKNINNNPDPTNVDYLLTLLVGRKLKCSVTKILLETLFK